MAALRAAPVPDPVFPPGFVDLLPQSLPSNCGSSGIWQESVRRLDLAGLAIPTGLFWFLPRGMRTSFPSMRYGRKRRKKLGGGRREAGGNGKRRVYLQTEGAVGDFVRKVPVALKLAAQCDARIEKVCGQQPAARHR